MQNVFSRKSAYRFQCILLCSRVERVQQQLHNCRGIKIKLNISVLLGLFCKYSKITVHSMLTLSMSQTDFISLNFINLPVY